MPGIGEKTAGALIAKYHCIEAVHEDAENVKPPRASKEYSGVLGAGAYEQGACDNHNLMRRLTMNFLMQSLVAE